MVILTTEKYDEICKYIQNYKGLWIECEDTLKDKFSDIDSLTTGSIFLTQKQNWMKQNHFTIKTPGTKKGQQRKSDPKSSGGKGKGTQEILAKYENAARKHPENGEHILRLAEALKFSPMSLARKLLYTKYPDNTKSEVTEMLRNFDLIPDPVFSLNVSYCVFNDDLESGISDISRRCIGEEYEVKLKEMSRNAGLVFYDEGDLRREGYDKTPDLKMAIPFMYQNKCVNWIESKALFGDLDTHKEIVKKQLLSYANRFGHGLVIYWFGFLNSILDYEGNGAFVTILDNFPPKSDIEILKFS